MPISPLRWDPIPVPTERLSVIEGMHTITTAGDAGAQGGMGTQVYVASRSMKDEYRLRFWTESGFTGLMIPAV
jgi:homogentisate 1,2-dioxygenase